MAESSFRVPRPMKSHPRMGNTCVCAGVLLWSGIAAKEARTGRQDKSRDVRRGRSGRQVIDISSLRPSSTMCAAYARGAPSAMSLICLGFARIVVAP